jgi:hypothetical protein
MATIKKTGTISSKAAAKSEVPAKRAAAKTAPAKTSAAKTTVAKTPVAKTTATKTAATKTAAAKTVPVKTASAKTAASKTAASKTTKAATPKAVTTKAPTKKVVPAKTVAQKTAPIESVTPKVPAKKTTATKQARSATQLKDADDTRTRRTPVAKSAGKTAEKADEAFSPELVSAMLADVTASEVAAPAKNSAPANVAAVTATSGNAGSEEGFAPPLALVPASAPVAKPRSAAASNIRIFQIYFDEQHKPHLDRDFEAYNNAGDKSPLLEFNVFDKLARSGELKGVDLWGALSWKFSQKFGMSGAEFKREIQAKPGYDVYFCNPHPSTEAIYHNLWLQGETAHPNFIMLCKEIFEVAGLPTSILTEVQPSAEFASANYFVATPAFWDAYLPFIKNILEAADKRLSPKSRAMLYSTAADHKGLHANVSYIPFVVERLFAVFLKSAGKKFRAQKIVPKQPAEGLNVHLKLLSEMKDVAHRTKSMWLAACWVNYRNLYLSNIYGADWAKKFIRKITPNSVTFSQGGSNITTGAPRT